MNKELENKVALWLPFWKTVARVVFVVGNGLLAIAAFWWLVAIWATALILASIAWGFFPDARR